MNIDVLDQGFVRLVDHMGDDQRIIDAARVSYQQGTERVEKDRGLIRYLMRHRHTSPTEKVVFEFHVKAPLFVVAQWARHRTSSWNFLSYRYSEAPDQFYKPSVLHNQSTTNKQGSGEIHPLDDDLRAALSYATIAAKTLYDDMIGKGVAREEARMVLPQNLYTEGYWTINLHNLFHFMGLRSDLHAQYEIRMYSEAIEEIVKGIVPLSYEAWVDYSKEGVHFSRMEMEVLREAMEGMDLVQLGKDAGLKSRERREWLTKVRKP